MTGLIFAILLGSLALAAGWTVIRVLDRGAVFILPERLLAAFCLGCVMLYLGVFAVGPFRMNAAAMAAVVVAVGLIGVPGWPGFGRWLRQGEAGSALGRLIRAEPRAALIWVITSVSLLCLLIQGLAPPSDYDSLNYHLALPQRDLEQGFIGPDWYGIGFAFFPQLSEHLVRIALALGGEQATQPVTGLFGLALALATALVTRRLGFPPVAAALAALMVVSVRMTVWELSTCEVEPQLATFTTLTLLAAMVWRGGGGRAAAVLFGLAAAGGALVKYHGLVVAACFAPLLLADLAARRIRLAELGLAILAAAVLLAPHFVRNLILTGNPVFPLLNPLFQPGGADFVGFAQAFGRSRSALDLLRVYWDVSILPTYYFDGVMLGAPYLLAFAPLVLAARGWWKLALPMLVVILLYTIAWFWLLSQQVRFLAPILPYLTVLAAMGAHSAWSGGGKAVRSAVAAAGLILAANQGLFVGVYAVLRLPPALGRVDALSYLDGTPTLLGSFYGACSYIRQRLGPEDWVLGILSPYSYYCPQARAVISPYLPEEQDYWAKGKPLPVLGPAELAKAMELLNVRFVVLPQEREIREGLYLTPEIRQTDIGGDRFGRLLAPVIGALTPLYKDRTAVVYDGRELGKALKRTESKP